MANMFNYAANINFTPKTQKKEEQYQTPMNMSIDTTIGRVKPKNPIEDEDML